MLANLVVFLSVSVAALAFVDFLLNDAQKKAVADSVTRMWDWLDEAKRVPLLDMARTRKSQRILLAIAICAVIAQYFAIWMLAERPESWKHSPEEPSTQAANPAVALAIILGFVAMMLWLGRRLISMMLRGKTALQLFGRASLVFLLLSLPTLLIVGLAIYSEEALTPESRAAFEGSGFYVFFVVVAGVLAVSSGVLWLFWAAAAGLVLFIYVGSFCLYIAEFTMRRIAEYPKGAILAGSVALGSITALIKAFW